MPPEKKKILELKQYMKCDKIPYVIYADIEFLIRKIDGCENKQEKFSAMKISEYIPCGYSISTIWGFEHTKNKYSLYRGNDCMKRFCTSLKMCKTFSCNRFHDTNYICFLYAQIPKLLILNIHKEYIQISSLLRIFLVYFHIHLFF